MKIAITGSSSYLASVLLPWLEADREVEKIVGIDLKPGARQFSKLEFKQRDVRDPEIAKDFAGCDTLVHLAYIVMPIHKTKTALEINIEGSKNVFTAAARAGINKIVYTSSCAGYGAWPDNPELITEDQPLRGMPDFYYSWSKARVEEFLNGFEKEHPGIILTRLRPCIFIGPNINNLMRHAVGHPFFIRFIDRATKAQFVWDEDVAQAVYLGLKKDLPGAFNLAGDGYITMEQMAELMGIVAIPMFYLMAKAYTWLTWNLHISQMLSPDWIASTEFPIVMTCDKAKKVMGWKPKYDTKTAFAKFVEEMLKLQALERERRWAFLKFWKKDSGG